jgi:hypothetical protein
MSSRLRIVLKRRPQQNLITKTQHVPKIHKPILVMLGIETWGVGCGVVNKHNILQNKEGQ